MHNQRLVILGASGHGKVVADIAFLIGRYQEVFFLDDCDEQQQCMGIPIIGRCNIVDDFLDSADFFVAIGNANIRRRLMAELITKGACMATLIHPDAVIGSNVQIGIGTVVMAGTVLNAECRIGCGCIVNTGATVDHDCVIGDYVHVSVGAHLAGTVTVGDNTWIGAGAIVNNNVRIIDSCMIGSGAVVVNNLDVSGIYVGIPAKELTK